MPIAARAARYGRGSGLYAPACSAVITNANSPACLAARSPSFCEQFVMMKRCVDPSAMSARRVSGHGWASPHRDRSVVAWAWPRPTSFALS